MRRHRVLWPLLVLALAGCLVLAGCGDKGGALQPPGKPGRDNAAWLAFLARKQPLALDADARLQWDVRGDRGAVAATVQTEAPALLRFTVNDPLGRTLYLVVSDGQEFTLVNSRKGRVYRGSMESVFWRSYVPAAVAPEDLLPMVAGFVRCDEAREARRLGGAGGAGGTWYAWNDRRGLTHHVLLDRDGATLSRHLLMDGQGNQVLDIQYADHPLVAAGGWPWPGRLRVTGPAVRGEIVLRIERIYGQQPRGAAAYRLTPPPHFEVEEVR